MDILSPSCAASTGGLYRQPLTPSEGSCFPATASNFFRSAQWSPDGTCIITTSEDYGLRTFVIPVDLLSNPKHHELSPYSSLSSGEPFYAVSVYPFFNLADTSSTLVLSSIRDHPVRLSNGLALDAGISASYPLVSPTTEKYTTPHSLAFTASGTHFIAGSDNLIAIFDVSRTGEGPIERHPTIPSKRKKIVGGGVGMKGVVSSVDISTDGILAAATLTRHIGLYGNEGRGDCVAVFSVAEDGALGVGMDGVGITQAKWSPCGRYLNVAERKSDAVQVYDIRVTGKRLGWLRGRKAGTNQRMGIDVVKAGASYEVWAGGSDGVARVWSDVAQTEGAVDPTAQWQAHEEPVSSTVIHQCGTVVATCSGQRHLWESTRNFGRTTTSVAEGYGAGGAGSETLEVSDTLEQMAPPRTQFNGAGKRYDNTLKVWSLQGLNSSSSSCRMDVSGTTSLNPA